jgi:hypothetical protein
VTEYHILRAHWCIIIVLNVHIPCKDKVDEVKDSFCEEIGCVFDQFPRCDMKILLGYFNAQVGREDISKPTIRNKNSH